jgi:hypothetical protein
MSQINFTFHLETKKYQVKLSNHGYFEIYDKDKLHFKDGWAYKVDKGALKETGYFQNEGLVDKLSEKELEKKAKSIFKRWKKSLTPNNRKI